MAQLCSAPDCLVHLARLARRLEDPGRRSAAESIADPAKGFQADCPLEIQRRPTRPRRQQSNTPAPGGRSGPSTEAEPEFTGSVPTPLSTILNGFCIGSLLAMCNVAVRAPAADG